MIATNRAMDTNSPWCAMLSHLSLPKTHPHELMVKTSTRGTGTDFIFGRDNH
jgi:hypothetical protein